MEANLISNDLSSSPEKLGLVNPFVLMTMHRPSNVDSPESLGKVIEIAQGLTQRSAVVFAIHPRTKKKIESLGWMEALQNTAQLFLTGPLGYLEFVKVMKEAALVITDSGGVQEETCYLRTPCITFRSSTERPSTVESGNNTLMSTLDVDATLQLAIEKLSDDGSQETTIPSLWDGQSAERIRDVLLHD
jgi:UDP-N-acetylglucosamine 2-epimerase (non-hydrolysing)